MESNGSPSNGTRIFPPTTSRQIVRRRQRSQLPHDTSALLNRKPLFWNFSANLSISHTLAASGFREAWRNRLPLATIEGFLKSLEDKWLLDTPAVQEKLSASRAIRGTTATFSIGSSFRSTPKKSSALLLPRTRWAFTTAFHVFAAFSILTGFIIADSTGTRFSRRRHRPLNLHGLLFLWLVVFTVSTMHEFSHGLTCCHFGGKVKEVGFMLIYFKPAFYCDVSDSWMFPSKAAAHVGNVCGRLFSAHLLGILHCRLARSPMTIRLSITSFWSSLCLPACRRL